MKYQLTFEIECGEKTCASSSEDGNPGKLCSYFMEPAKKRYSCWLFQVVLGEFTEVDKVLRHPDCLKLAKKVEEK